MLETPLANIERLGPGRAACAFNVENFETLDSAIAAAALSQAPVILGVTVPAAHQLGFGNWVQIAETLADQRGACVSVHLDHAEREPDIRAAIEAGFTGVNILNEGALDAVGYLDMARGLKKEFGQVVSWECVLGVLVHIHDDPHAHRSVGGHGLADILAFHDSLKPDILGFECGSRHGMSERTASLDLELIEAVASKTGTPIVLHGSSGVAENELKEGIRLGVRKVNIETALRREYLTALRQAVSPDNPDAHKPRKVSQAVKEHMVGVYCTYLDTYSLGVTDGRS